MKKILVNKLDSISTDIKYYMNVQYGILESLDNTIGGEFLNQEQIEELIDIRSKIKKLSDSIKKDTTLKKDEVYTKNDLEEAFDAGRTVYNYNGEWLETFQDDMSSAKFKTFDDWLNKKDNEKSVTDILIKWCKLVEENKHEKEVWKVYPKYPNVKFKNLQIILDKDNVDTNRHVLKYVFDTCQSNE